MKCQQKKLLMVAYAFPPHSVVGSMRPLRIAKYLKMVTGWNPIVLTVDMEFERKDNTLLQEIPADVHVYRSCTVEPATRLEQMVSLLANRKKSSIAHIVQYPLMKICSWAMEIFSIPDAELFWNISVIWKSLQIIRKRSVNAVLITSPPWSLQIAGYMLKRLTAVPWIADFRDPWTDIKRKNHPIAIDMFEQWLERKLLTHADLVLSTSDTYTNDLKKKYPQMDQDKFQTLHNGYDEEKFTVAPAKGNDKFTIVHLGTLYSWFKPDIFFEALAEWLSTNNDIANNIELQFIGKVPVQVESLLRELGLLDITRITGFVPHAEAIASCCRADVLLLALGTDNAVPKGWLPSKLFEYLALNRPILAYVAEGEAASMVRNINRGYVVSERDKSLIVKILNRLYEKKWSSPDRFIPWTNDPVAIEKLRQPYLMERLGYLLDSITK